MDVTVIKTWWFASWEVKLTMLVVAFTALDPLTWMATNPDYMAMIPLGLAGAVAVMVKWAYMGSMLYLRFVKTDSKIVFKKSDATPQIDKDKARAVAVVKKVPSAAEVAAAQKTLENYTKAAEQIFKPAKPVAAAGEKIDPKFTKEF